MFRQIVNLYEGKEIKYFDHTWRVDAVYPYIAYLVRKEEGEEIRICVNIGDLVIAGIEPSLPLTIQSVSQIPM